MVCTVSISILTLDKTFCDRDDPYVRDKSMLTRLNRPDRLSKTYATETNDSLLETRLYTILQYNVASYTVI